MKKKPLFHLEFGVNSLDDIRLLVQEWEEVLLDFFDQSEWDFQLHTALVTGFKIVRVTIEDRLPGQEVLLKFAAPKEIIIQFLDTLEAKGVAFQEQTIIPKMLIKCRMTPPTE
jgi:hypothetical protein